ncbi:MAG: cytochrome ubiquinol oxidase subunit I, partial [Candidatus Omnitrophica bacterium]|nr:cytochrome ubiquinol oxidase subunit I [Candidatus Omnitrophota bacterium]
AMFNDAWFSQALHMSLAAIVATGFAVAGIHAWLLLKEPKNQLHQKAFSISIWFAIIAAFLQPISGDISSKDIARRQPLKLAAAEALFETQTHAPLHIGGVPNMRERRVDYAITIPGGLSFLSFFDVNAEVKGLDAFPQEEWPPVPVVHYAFQLMVGIGIFLMLVGIIFLYLYFRKKKQIYHPVFLRLIAWCTPLGFIAVEAGWTVTEVGRQPWILYGILKTKETLTPMPGLVYSFLAVTVIYLLLSVVVVWLMTRQFKVVSMKFRGQGS